MEHRISLCQWRGLGLRWRNHQGWPPGHACVRSWHYATTAWAAANRNQTSLVHWWHNRWKNAERRTKLVGPTEQKWPRVKSINSWILVKEAIAEEAKRQFSGTGVQITTEGKRLLGAAIGTDEFVEKFAKTSNKSISSNKYPDWLM